MRPLLGMVYVALTSAVAWRVLHMVLLCETEGDGIGMGAGGTTMGIAIFARRSSVGENVGMGMGLDRTMPTVWSFRVDVYAYFE